ncbi:uncharacterized protein [Drosophila kikkawai]|uniref:Uncharacterized protein LOC108072873 n=1 Tax=Drosophila kikkawai TaxID=30033 RepID=A0A6P4HUC2_DROKI|nr:uncharacterized protein LOC108072873 [Drosophila kikkawai]XP_017019692.1 uncharacterized protein LOC108072873 [Drosophila kikkawai]XP_017019700.1 uncharacterized protein LOC108072873 [Drosophila kikkawai]
MHLRAGSKKEAKEIVWICLFFSISFSILYCDAHGRLIEPPSRASAWRYGFQTPPDYNDHELYCGGFTRQWKKNKGKCGECGDPWDIPEPRPHESGGQWGQGLIVKTYFPGSEMTIRVELTASHMGYFEFRLCPRPNAKQFCLDQNVLPIMGGFPIQPSPTDLQSRFYPRNGSRIYEIKARLPDFTCDHCVLQWRYIAGNNWGICDDGIGAVGCGPQEEFRSCSDISLSQDLPVPTKNPLFTTSPKSTKILTSTEQMADNNHRESLNYCLLISLVIIIFCSVLGIWYRFKELKQFLYKNTILNERKQFSFGTFFHKTNFFQFKCHSSQTASDLSNDIVRNPPIPPPRTKKLEKIITIQVDESISV